MNVCQCPLITGSRQGQSCGALAKYPVDHPLFCGRHNPCKISSTITQETEPEHLQIQEHVSISPRPPPIKNCRQLRMLSGPSYFVYFPVVDNKRILLLGESHYNTGLAKTTGNNDVYEVHRWLSDLAHEAPECLDLMVETPYITRPVPIYGSWEYPNLGQYQSPLEAIEDIFRSCHTTDIDKKQKCHSPMLRFHYLDFRRWNEINGVGGTYWIFFGILKNQPNALEIAELHLHNQYWERRGDLYNFVLGLDPRPQNQLFFEQYLSDFRHVVYDDTPETSNSYRNVDYRDFLDAFRKLTTKESHKLKGLDWTQALQILSQLYLKMYQSIAFTLFIIPMDLYCLMRIFIQYDSTKMSRGPSGCQALTYTKNKNIIVYAGLSHIDLYRRFIEKYFEIQPTINILDFKSGHQFIVLDPPFDFFANT